MKITNINGTSQNKCSCGSWLKHWEKFSARTTKYCYEKNCLETGLVGAHVQKADSTDQSWFIAPLCQSHNMSKTDIELISGAKLVSANKSKTCGY